MATRHQKSGLHTVMTDNYDNCSNEQLLRLLRERDAMEHEALITLDGNIYAGDLPRCALSLVRE